MDPGEQAPKKRGATKPLLRTLGMAWGSTPWLLSGAVVTQILAALASPLQLAAVGVGSKRRRSACRRSIAPVQRIAVIGCGGAGKTTLANELGRRLDLPVLHIDGSYWQQRPDGEHVESTPEQWRAIHAEMIAGARWVIDGMKLGALPARLEAADTIVFLDLPAWRCLWGVLCRRLRYRGQMRPDIGVYDRVNAEFVRWIWSFGRTARPRILDLLSECSCDVVVCTSRREVRSFLQSLARQKARFVG
jgi:adenylate kinase family enzyme